MRKKIMATILFIVFASSHQSIISMQKNKLKNSSIGLPTTLETLIKKNYSFNNLTTKIQVAITEGAIKNGGGLQEVWQRALERTLISATIHKKESVIIVQINVADASKKLKKHFKPQITSKTIRQIQKGKMTSPFKPTEPPPTEQKSRALYSSTLYGLMLFSAGWLGKTWWDAGGKNQTIKVGSFLLNTIIHEFTKV